jgi:hypothetical protein
MPETPPSAVDEEAAYYQAVEEFFVSRRGDPLFLSNADWLLIRRWRTAGIPLRVVLRGIGDALEAHAHSWSRERKVGSLRYCEAEVEVARDRWERAVATGTDGAELEAGLGRLVVALARPSGLGPASAAVAREILARLEAASPSVAPRDTEAWLSREEARLLAEIRRESPERAAQAAEEVAREIAPYRERMPERVARQIEEDALARRLLAAHGLPRLSLFLQ